MARYEVGVIAGVTLADPAVAPTRHALRLTLNGPRALCGAGAAQRLPGTFEPGAPTACTDCSAIVEQPPAANAASTSSHSAAPRLVATR